MFQVSRAQDIEESLEQMSLGQQNAMIVSLPYDVKLVEDVWKDYLKNFKGRSKKQKRSDIVFTDDASISDVSDNTVDIYSEVNKMGDGASLKIWMDLGGGFVDSRGFPDAYDGVVRLIQGFEKDLNVEHIKIELKEEERRLNDLDKSLSKLERLNEKYHKEIENWKEKILENEEEIEVNFSDQEEAQKAIDAQKEVIRLVEVKLSEAESN